MTVLSDFLARTSHRPYRELVQHHVRKQSTSQLMAGATGTVELLPKDAQRLTIEFIDALNEKLAHDERFWRHADVKTAFGKIIQIAIGFLPIWHQIGSERDAYEERNHELAFNIFQVATLSFAYSASKTRAQRKFMGIRKGLFRA